MGTTGPDVGGGSCTQLCTCHSTQPDTRHSTRLCSNICARAHPLWGALRATRADILGACNARSANRAGCMYVSACFR